MNTLDDLRAALEGNTIKKPGGVQRTVDGYELTFEDGARLCFPAAWIRLDAAPGKVEHSGGGKVGRQGGEGAG